MARDQERAFTKVDLLVIVMVIGVIFITLSPSVIKRYMRGSQVSCVNHLKNIGLAMRIFATDHNDLFPMQASTNQGGVKEFMDDGKNLFRVFQNLSNELQTPKIIACTIEPQIHATNFHSLQNSNISYFVGVDAMETEPNRILAGDRNLHARASNIRNGILSVTTNDFVRWTEELHQFEGNLAVSDGSVMRVRTKQLQAMLRQTGLATNRFILRE